MDLILRFTETRYHTVYIDTDDLRVDEDDAFELAELISGFKNQDPKEIIRDFDNEYSSEFSVIEISKPKK
jgi:hypothetical protein